GEVPKRVTIVCSANLKGALEPCTCQADQGGGLSRRKTLLQSVRRGGTDPILIDCGNLVALTAPSQKLHAEARGILADMGYSAMAVGPAELGLGSGWL